MMMIIIKPDASINVNKMLVLVDVLMPTKFITPRISTSKIAKMIIRYIESIPKNPDK